MVESGLQFDFSYAEGTTWEQMVAFETAGMMWSDYITDNMTVNIHVEMTSELPENVIGGALPGMVADVNYSDFRNAYRQDITSWRDSRDFDSLSLLHEGYGGKGAGKTKEKFEARIDFGGDYFVEDSSELNMTRANAKALGLISGNDTSLDGYIMMNDLSDSSLEWDYSKYWSPKESLDFLSTAVHEIGHVLGFVSGVDKYEGLKFHDAESFWNHFGTYDAFKKYTNGVLEHANPLDLFRYSQESLDINNGRNTIDMSIGTQAYFGPAQLWDAYATGKETSLDGDGFQASHWKHDHHHDFVIGIMDPLMKPGVIRRISDRDLRAMDAIGYNVNGNAENLLQMNIAANNWQPSTGGGADVSTLQWRAKDHIAKSLYSNGEASWVDWWAENHPASANALSSDKSSAIDKMIKKSKIYEGRRSRGRSYSRQEIFFQESYFSSISSEYSSPAVKVDNSDSTFVSAPIIELESANSTLEFVEQDAIVIEKNNIEITRVDSSLISLTEPEIIDTVSTELDTELVAEASLYSDRTEESVLAISLTGVAD